MNLKIRQFKPTWSLNESDHNQAWSCLRIPYVNPHHFYPTCNVQFAESSRLTGGARRRWAKLLLLNKTSRLLRKAIDAVVGRGIAPWRSGTGGRGTAEQTIRDDWWLLLVCYRTGHRAGRPCGTPLPCIECRYPMLVAINMYCPLPFMYARLLDCGMEGAVFDHCALFSQYCERRAMCFQKTRGLE